jgi:hypothetical protein
LDGEVGKASSSFFDGAGEGAAPEQEYPVRLGMRKKEGNWQEGKSLLFVKVRRRRRRAGKKKEKNFLSPGVDAGAHTLARDGIKTGKSFWVPFFGFSNERSKPKELLSVSRCRRPGSRFATRRDQGEKSFLLLFFQKKKALAFLPLALPFSTVHRRRKAHDGH